MKSTLPGANARITPYQKGASENSAPSHRHGRRRRERRRRHIRHGRWHHGRRRRRSLGFGKGEGNFFRGEREFVSYAYEQAFWLGWAGLFVEARTSENAAQRLTH